ncbi:SPOR domain-containing protein [Aestuariivivens sp. NBU2969]|uniref:SPOR domain-containing protein n=1 Tax=Aestuariivivens sp. NBU2969 TaxID=2873267 RepID=UPI001CBED578|nr:SPOR domain-containing protein [Aestuariivivens sp. NBU2969]
MKSLTYKTLLFIVITCCTSISFMNAQQGRVILNQDSSINALLELKKEMNKNSNDYYKIQIYSGARVEAYQVQKEFNDAFSDWKAIDAYEEPNYKIWVGAFRTRLEADRALKQIKQKFPSAFIFKPKK